MITAKSYFSGAGGMDLGLSLSGIEIIQSLEIDAQASMTLRANLPHDVLNMDIKDIRVGDQPGSDILVGTYPCTKYSAIADIHNYRKGDKVYLEEDCDATKYVKAIFGEHPENDPMFPLWKSMIRDEYRENIFIRKLNHYRP